MRSIHLMPGGRRRWVCFFFQAEDGIRDIGVTGVQTCALPILDLRSSGLSIRPILDLAGEEGFNEITFDDVFVPDSLLVGKEGEGWKQATAELAFRSEERRVGKECRSRWSPYH